MKVQISDLIRTELISPHLDVKDKVALFWEMTLSLVKAGILNDEQHETLHKAICHREDFQCTAIGEGLAIPHAYMAALPENLILIGRVSKMIDFGSDDCGDVNMVFLLIGPNRDNTEHLRILARLVRLLKDEQFLQELRQAPDAEAIAKAFVDVEQRHY